MGMPGGEEKSTDRKGEAEVALAVLGRLAIARRSRVVQVLDHLQWKHPQPSEGWAEVVCLDVVDLRNSPTHPIGGVLNPGQGQAGT